MSSSRQSPVTRSSLSAAQDNKAPQYEAEMPNGRPGWTKYFETFSEVVPSGKSFPFATVAKGSNTPHVRYVIYRFLSSGPHSLIAITTDTRSKKYTHLRENPECEAAFWFEDVGVQFRVSGKAYVLPSGEHEGETETKADEEASKILNSIATGEEGNVEFWKEKREELWKKQSGHLRASFARPTPGKPLKEVDHAAKECFETLPAEGNTDAEKKEINFARSHFSLVVIAPTAVEMLELTVVPNRKHVWRKDSNGWTIEALRP